MEWRMFATAICWMGLSAKCLPPPLTCKRRGFNGIVIVVSGRVSRYLHSATSSIVQRAVRVRRQKVNDALACTQRFRFLFVCVCVCLLFVFTAETIIVNRSNFNWQHSVWHAAIVHSLRICVWNTFVTRVRAPQRGMPSTSLLCYLCMNVTGFELSHPVERFGKNASVAEIAVSWKRKTPMNIYINGMLLFNSREWYAHRIRHFHACRHQIDSPFSIAKI